MRRWMITGWLVVSLPAVALAQDAGTPEQRITAALNQAASAGIPASLLETTLAEQQAAGVAMDRIADAVEYRLDALTRARSALAKGGHEVNADEMAAGADAIGVGVSNAALTKIAETEDAPWERRMVAVAVLTELVDVHNIPVGDALIEVEAALARGAGELENLPAEARAGQRPGIPAAAAGRPGFGGVPAWLGRPGGGAGRPAGAGRP